MPARRKISRRRFCQTALVSTLAAPLFSNLVTPRRGIASPTDYRGLATGDFLGPVKTLAKVVDDKVFTEGPAVDPEGNVLFTNVPASKILRWDSRRKQLTLFRENTNQANGLLIEADGKADHHRDIRAYELGADGSLDKGRVLIDFYPGRSGDGMCIDAAGNLYVAAGLHNTRGSSETLDTRPGIHVVSPEGKLLAFRETPEDTITNCTFGGEDRRTLYVTCGSLLVSLRTEIPGKA